MEHTPLRQLGAGQRGAKIRCRVLKIWDSKNPSQQDQLMTVDLFLADENGDCIQASIRKEDAPRLRGLFEEGKIYNIANFIMAPARRKFRLSQNESLIRIGTWTIVREQNDPHSPIPLHYFTFIDEEALESRLYNDVFLTDFLGYLINVGQLRDTYANGRVVPVRNIDLQTTRIPKITATLWGMIAEGFNEEEVDKQPKDKAIVVILSAMTVRAYKADTALSSTCATRIYLNLQIPEVDNFRTQNEQLNDNTQLLPVPVENQDFRAEASPQKMTVLALLSLDRITNLGIKYSCDATIIEIDASQGWSYNACAKCKAGVSSYNGILSCQRCGPISSLPIPWYKVTVVVTDGQREAKFLMFGKHIEKMLKISASNLSEMADSKTDAMPPVILQLRGARCNFIVTINDRDLNPTELTFSVSNVIPNTLPLNIKGEPESINEQDPVRQSIKKGSSILKLPQLTPLPDNEKGKDIVKDELNYKRTREWEALEQHSPKPPGERTMNE